MSRGCVTNASQPALLHELLHSMTSKYQTSNGSDNFLSGSQLNTTTTHSLQEKVPSPTCPAAIPPQKQLLCHSCQQANPCLCRVTSCVNPPPSDTHSTLFCCSKVKIFKNLAEISCLVRSSPCAKWWRPSNKSQILIQEYRRQRCNHTQLM